jgi:hypothetical protein
MKKVLKPILVSLFVIELNPKLSGYFEFYNYKIMPSKSKHWQR